MPAASSVSTHLRISSGRRALRDRPKLGRPRSTDVAALATGAYAIGLPLQVRLLTAALALLSIADGSGAYDSFLIVLWPGPRTKSRKLTRPLAWFLLAPALHGSL